MLPILTVARPRPSFLAGAHSMQTLLARARPHPSFLVVGHLQLQTVPLSENRPEMFLGQSQADERHRNDVSYHESMTMMLPVSAKQVSFCNVCCPSVLQPFPLVNVGEMTVPLRA